MLRQDLQAKILKDMIAARLADGVSDSAIEPLNETIRHSFVEIVEKLIPPVAQSVRKLARVLVTGFFCAPYSGLQETYSLGTIMNLFTDGAKLFLEQVEGAKYRRCF